MPAPEDSLSPETLDPEAINPELVDGAPTGLGGRAARGAAITMIGQGARIVLQLASVVVLARLLTPVDYGLLALVLVVVGIGEIFRDFGLSTAAVQAKHLSRGQQDALFWTNTGLGVTLTVLVFLLAGPIADAWNRPPLFHMLQVLSLTFTINGLSTQYRAHLNRQLSFGWLSISDVGGQAGGLVVGIVCASLGAGYWSLVAQQLAQVFVVLVLLAIGSRWLPHWPRGDRDIRSLVKMGAHFGATQGLYYVMNNLDTVTIGIRFSPTALGVYNRGFQAISTPLNQLRAPATTVAVPVLSRLHDDPKRAGQYLVRGQLALGYTLVAGLAIAAGAARPVVAVLLGSRWTEAVPIVAFLAIAGCMSTLSFVGLWVYLARGMARQLMQYTAVSLVLQLICIVGGSQWGVNGVAAGYAVAAALEWPLSLWWLSRRTEIPLGELTAGATRITVCGTLAGLAAFGISEVGSGWTSILQALVALLAGAAVYGVLALVSTRVRADLVIVAHLARRMVRG
jgi:O-antigen/teichoic acid export membrane protein